MSELQSESQTSWLGTITFAFVAMYTHLSLGISMATMTSAVFFAVGLAMSKILLDIPAQFAQRKIYCKNTEGLSREAKNQGAEKAAAIGTFIKATQVIIAFAAAKMAHPYFF